MRAAPCPARVSRRWPAASIPPRPGPISSSRRNQLAQLREICDHATYRHVVLGRWGFDRKLTLGKGLNALFSGPPGTGKTLAAQVIARELRRDLYQIDLSQVVSKFIGETEKNLRQLFDEAEANHALLFFDEADALFGKRSEVKDAHDRYANLEVGYLLQRMEEYEGIAILATNFRQNLDEAFVRRLRFIVEFPFPDEEQRRRIWEVTFPGGRAALGRRGLPRARAHGAAVGRAHPQHRPDGGLPRGRRGPADRRRTTWPWPRAPSSRSSGRRGAVPPGPARSARREEGRHDPAREGRADADQGAGAVAAVAGAAAGHAGRGRRRGGPPPHPAHGRQRGRPADVDPGASRRGRGGVPRDRERHLPRARETGARSTRACGATWRARSRRTSEACGSTPTRWPTG
jgi:hypothetical protein